MRGGTRQRPASQHGAMQASAQPVRKIFNCIVDDSALVAGVKKSTRNGIRQWVRNGQIRLFVPLHALDQLGRQRETPGKHGEDVRDTLQWLDDITSKHPNIVTLQGADETYEQWSEVEKFVVPRTLFSEDDCVEEFATEAETTTTTVQGMAKLALDEPTCKAPASSIATDATRSLSPSSFKSQHSSMSVPSPPTSPIKENASPAVPSATRSRGAASSSRVVPVQLQPLFNYILWRIHQEVDPVAALESFIFLCNDQRKVNFSKGFEIKTKRLEQLREAINREDREYRNRVALVNKEGQADTTATSANEDDDDEVVYKPPPRAPAAMLPKQRPAPAQCNVMDPDAFGRTSQVPKAQPASPRPQTFQPYPEAFSNAFAGLGRSRGNARGNARARGSFGRATTRAPARPDTTLSGPQIDPNSFARPRGSGYTGRGARKLWVPT